MFARKIVRSFLIALIFIGLILSSVDLLVANGSTNAIGIINSDTTWTKAESPYTLTGPVAVNLGVKLTIQPGAAVNLNGFYIQVNGTLTAIGTSTDQIQFTNGELILSQ